MYVSMCVCVCVCVCMQNLRVGANWKSLVGPLARAATIHREGVHNTNKVRVIVFCPVLLTLHRPVCLQPRVERLDMMPVCDSPDAYAQRLDL